MSPAADGGGETIPALTAAAADRFGERLAVVDGDTRLSYRELFDEARRFGAALVACGVEPGDRVAIWAFNSAEWVVAVLGLWQAGAVLVPVNTRFKGEEAVDILSRSGAKVLVTVTDFLGTDYVAMLDHTGAELPDLRTIVVARGPAPRPASRGTRSWPGRPTRGGSRSTGAAPPSPPTMPRTSSSPPGPPACPRGSSRRMAARCWWRGTGWR